MHAIEGDDVSLVESLQVDRGRNRKVVISHVPTSIATSTTVGGPPRARGVSDTTRRHRYLGALCAHDSPVRADLVPFDDLLDEPLYQMMRQQLLAHELEKAHALGASRVRVIHVLPSANDDYQASLHQSSTRALGDSVSAVWQELLRRPDRFVGLDSAVFLDRQITSDEYVARYGP